MAPNATTKNQINHVKINKGHRSWVKNVWSYRGVDDDKDLVVISVNWSSIRKRNKKNILDMEKMKNK